MERAVGLLDHDLSTVIFDPDGRRLLGLRDIASDWKRLTDRGFRPDRQHGWLICGLSAGDNASYATYGTADYLAGYAGPPPMVHLRRGETLRRYLDPGLEDGKTFVFWGRNYNAAGIPGPERPQTWVNQPDAMFGSKTGAGFKPGRARYANAIFTYRPDFATIDYREGVVSENDSQVTLEFQRLISLRRRRRTWRHGAFTTRRARTGSWFAAPVTRRYPFRWIADGRGPAAGSSPPART